MKGTKSFFFDGNTCKICKKKKSTHRVMDHIGYHANMRLRCNCCAKLLCTICGWKEHYITCARKTNYMRSECDLSVNALLKNVIDLMRCAFCDINFISLDEVRDHFNTLHTKMVIREDNNQLSLIDSEQQNIISQNVGNGEEHTNCPICFMRLLPGNFTKHFESEHPGPFFPCPACAEIFERQKSWEMHWEKEHQNQPSTQSRYVKWKKKKQSAYLLQWNVSHQVFNLKKNLKKYCLHSLLS